MQTLGREKRSQAMTMRDTEVSRDFQERQFQESIRQFNEQQAAAQRAAAAAASAGYGFGGGSAAAPTPAAQNGAARIDRSANGGFNFFDGVGKAINASQYSQLTGKGYREVLSQMAKAGDKNAQIALNYVGNDGKFGNAPAQYKAALSAVGATGSFVSPALKKATNYSLSSLSMAGMK